MSRPGLLAAAVLALGLVTAGCQETAGQPAPDAGQDAAPDAAPADAPTADAAPADAPTADAVPADAAKADAAPADATRGDVAPDVAPARLCDGSGSVRLVFANHGGGPLWSTFSFSGAYGHAFFVVDGSCRYWAGQAFLRGIRTGTLTQPRADAIARELHYAAFERLKAFSGRACPDASTRTLSDGTHRVSCTCDYSHQAPAEYTEAFARVQGVLTELFDGGAQADLPIRVIATEPEGGGAVLTWPLGWSPADVLVPLQPNPPANAGRLVTDAAEVRQLRTLRASFPNLDHPMGIKVRDAGGRTFSVYPRDDAPATVAAAIVAATR